MQFNLASLVWCKIFSMKSIEATRTSLQMLSPNEHKSVVNIVGDRLHITQIFDCPASFYRYLYCEVGRDYHWVDRRSWSDQQIQAHLSQPGISLWVLYYRGLSSSTHQLPKTGISTISPGNVCCQNTRTAEYSSHSRK